MIQKYHSAMFFEVDCPQICADHGEAATPTWHAVYTVPRHEKRLAKHFLARGIEHFLPTYQALRRWKDGSRVNLDLPLFPSYIFVHICGRQRTSVLQVPGVVRIVGRRTEPDALRESEIEALRRGVISAKLEPHPYLVVGQRARVINGPFSGMEGVLVRKKNSYRVVLTLSVIMQSVAVELDICDLLPVETGLAGIVPLPSAA